MPKRKRTAKELEKVRQEAIELRKEARLIKKQTQEIIKKSSVKEGIKRDLAGRLLPGTKPTHSKKDEPNLPPVTIQKGFSLKTMIRRKLEEIEPKNQKTYAELLVSKIIKMAIVDGNESQIKNILQYLEGMPKQTLEGSLDVKTALVSFIGGAIQGSQIEQIDSGEEIKQLEQSSGIDRNEDKEIENIENANS